MYKAAYIGHKAVGAQPPVLQRCQLFCRHSVSKRRHRLCVTASRGNGGNSRVIRGKCYITRDVRGSCLCLAYFAHDCVDATHTNVCWFQDWKQSLTKGGGFRT